MERKSYYRLAYIVLLILSIFCLANRYFWATKAEADEQAKAFNYLPLMIHQTNGEDNNPAPPLPEIRINFQLEGASIPDGFMPDYGYGFKEQNSYSYGWNFDHTDEARDRGKNSNQLLDTLIHIKTDGIWEIALPNGSYKVTISVGDPSYASTYTVNAEGVNFWYNTYLNKNKFRTEQRTVVVNDGRLTVDDGNRAHKEVRLNYIVIAPINGGTVPQPTATTTAPSSPEPSPTTMPTATPSPSPTPPGSATPGPTPQVTGNVFYVSRHGSNGDGRSWSNAWNEMNRINWGVIQPGDTIVLDGGQTQMIYETPLEIGKSGTQQAPIRVTVSGESGRNGQVVIFGGRTQKLPGYCGQANYTDEDNVDYLGFDSNNHSWIILDGVKWRGILIHGFERGGMLLDRGSTDITVRYVEVYNNGKVIWSNTYSKWRSDNPGVILGGTNMTFQRVIVHDNGQDAFQSLWGTDNNLRNFRLEESWLYNGDSIPINLNNLDEDCIHTDGLQIYDGGEVTGVVMKDSIIGPGFMNAIILGQTTTSRGANATVSDVVIDNVLFIKPTNNSVYGYSDTNSRRWTVNNVTSYCSNIRGNCLRIRGGDHTISNSIFYDGNIWLPDQVSLKNNCTWETSGHDIGTEAELKFANANPNDYATIHDDFTLLPNSPCQSAGSTITSVAQLLNR